MKIRELKQKKPGNTIYREKCKLEEHRITGIIVTEKGIIMFSQLSVYECMHLKKVSTVIILVIKD